MDYFVKFTGGNPDINLDDLERTALAAQDFIKTHFQGYQDAYFAPANPVKDFTIKGCEITIGGGNISTAAGYIWLEGEVVQADAQIIAYDAGKYYYFVKTTTYDANGTKTFVDGNVRQTWKKIRAVLTEYATTQVRYQATSQILLHEVITGIVKNDTGLINTKVIEIGDWDMDTDTIASIAHGLSGDWKKIRSVSVIIRNDADNAYYNLERANGSDHELQGEVVGIDSTNIVLQIKATGFFDSTDFNSTSYNRGWITIQYAD